MKILIITQYFPPEIGAAAERMNSLAGFLSERAQVAVLAPVPSYPWGIIPKEDRALWDRHAPKDVEIIRVYKFPHRKNFLLRLFGELQYTLYSLGKACLLPRPDLVIISSPSFFLGFIGLALKIVKKVEYVFDVRDLYPDSVLDAGVLRNGFLYHLLKRLEKVFYSHARLVSVVHETWLPAIEASAKRVVIVPNGVDFQQFYGGQDPLSQRLSPDKLNLLESHFVVLFLGNLGIFYDFSPFLSAARKISLKGHDDVQFVFLGEGIQKRDFMNRVKNESIPNCHFWDPVPSGMIPAILSQSNVGIVSRHPHMRSTRGCIPNKVYEYLAGDLDVIACLQGDLPRDLLESGKFFVFENLNVNGIVKKILDIKSAGRKSETSRELLEKMSRKNHFEQLWNAIRTREEAEA